MFSWALANESPLDRSGEQEEQSRLVDGHVEGHRAVFLTSSAKVRQFGGGGGGGGSGGGGGGGGDGSGDGGGGGHPPFPFHSTIPPCLDSDRVGL